MFRGVLMFLALAVSAPSEAGQFEEGLHYVRLPVAVATADPGKVEVVEVFSYACPHCKDFDPELEVWRGRQPRAVDFQRLPANFNATYEILARAFYTAEALEVTDRVHMPIFHAIHDRGIDLRRPELLAALFEEIAGIAPKRFHQVFDSFSVRGRVQQADARGRAYRLSGVPTLIVDGLFSVDVRMAGGNAEMLAVVDQLVDQQSAAKGIELVRTPVAAEVE